MKRTLNLRPSSWVAGADYDDDARTMIVTFLDGHVQTYLGIDSALAQDFEMAASPGGFVHRHLRGREG